MVRRPAFLEAGRRKKSCLACRVAVPGSRRPCGRILPTDCGRGAGAAPSSFTYKQARSRGLLLLAGGRASRLQAGGQLGALGVSLQGPRFRLEAGWPRLPQGSPPGAPHPACLRGGGAPPGRSGEAGLGFCQPAWPRALSLWLLQ